MRIVVVSDIHSNLAAFETVVKHLPAYDKLICLGDTVGYGPQPNEVIEQLRQLEPAVVLLGNHDNAVVTGDTSNFSNLASLAIDWTRKNLNRTNLTYLSNLKASAHIELEGVSLGLFHGSPNDPLAEYIYPGMSGSSARRLIHNGGARAVLLGHTHMPMLYMINGEMLGNPGSVGQPRDGDPRASYAILTLRDGMPSLEFVRVNYDIDQVAQKIIKAGLPTFLAERLHLGI